MARDADDDPQAVDFFPSRRHLEMQDGVIVNVSDVAFPAFRGNVFMTAKLWAAAMECPAKRSEETHQRTLDIISMASRAHRALTARGESSGDFPMILQVGETRDQVLRVVDDDGEVTIGFAEDSYW